MEIVLQSAYVRSMASMGFQSQNAARHRPETDADREARIVREEAIIAKAEGDIDAGLGIEDDVVEQWLDGLDHQPDAPLPTPHRG